MSEEDEKGTAVIMGVASNAATAVVIGAASILRLGPPELALGLGLFAGAVPEMIRLGFAKRAERRCALAAAGMKRAADEQGGTPEELPNSEQNQETLLSMFNDLLDAVDDAAAAPLGHLTMTYARLSLGPDRFFRAFGRVVRELDAEEIGDLVRVLEECVRRMIAQESPFADTVALRTAFGDTKGHSIEARGKGDNDWGAAVRVTNGVRLLLLLKQHGLANEPTNIPVSFDGAPVTASFDRGFCERALTHLRP